MERASAQSTAPPLARKVRVPFCAGDIGKQYVRRRDSAHQILRAKKTQRTVMRALRTDWTEDPVALRRITGDVLY